MYMIQVYDYKHMTNRYMMHVYDYKYMTNRYMTVSI